MCERHVADTDRVPNAGHDSSPCVPAVMTLAGLIVLMVSFLRWDQECGDPAGWLGYETGLRPSEKTVPSTDSWIGGMAEGSR
jgi:hypothetical protein